MPIISGKFCNSSKIDLQKIDLLRFPLSLELEFHKNTFPGKIDFYQLQIFRLTMA